MCTLTGLPSLCSEAKGLGALALGHLAQPHSPALHLVFSLLSLGPTLWTLPLPERSLPG